MMTFTGVNMLDKNGTSLPGHKTLKQLKLLQARGNLLQSFLQGLLIASVSGSKSQ